MKTIFQTIFFAATLALLTPVAAQSTSDREAINRVMQDFISAYETGDGNFMRKAFRNDGIMVGHATKSNRVLKISGEEFAQRFDGKPDDDAAERKRTVEILDIAENGALAKVTLDYPTWAGVDYIALAKIEGKWMIVSKSWSGKVKPGPKP